METTAQLPAIPDREAQARYGSVLCPSQTTDASHVHTLFPCPAQLPGIPRETAAWLLKQTRRGDARKITIFQRIVETWVSGSALVVTNSCRPM